MARQKGEFVWIQGMIYICVHKKSKEMETAKQPQHLNEIQLGLLRMFNRNIPDADVQAIKQVIVKHLSQQLFDEVDKVVKEKNIIAADYDRLEEEDFRTKSK